MHPATCANCDAPLTGPYCAQCGQHAHHSARALGTLVHAAWHDLTHLDGRLWRTLAALLLRPGRLTLEYFAERRARYLPPVRLYLVLSVLFFALSPVRFADPAAGASATDPATVAAAGRAADREPREPGAAARSGAKSRRFVIGVDSTDCDKIESSIEWLEEPLRRVCRRNAADGGRAALHAFGASVPKVMFVFLPVMALVMLLLYRRPRRYYVEHVVFFLHTHAALFLVLILERVLSWLIAWLPRLATPGEFARFAGFVYTVWYVYRAVSVYYGQSRWLTLAKLAVVSLAYLVFLSITLAATMVVSAATA